MIGDIIVFELETTGPTQINTSVDGCLIPDVNLHIKQTLTLCWNNPDFSHRRWANLNSTLDKRRAYT